MSNAQIVSAADQDDNENAATSAPGNVLQNSEQDVEQKKENNLPLPTEIRRLVYAAFFQSTPYSLTDRCPSRFKGIWTADKLSTHRKDVHNVFLVSHDVVKEARPIFLKTTTFTMTAPSQEPYYRLLPYSRASIVPFMRHLVVEVTAYHEVTHLLKLIRIHGGAQLQSVVVRNSRQEHEEDLIQFVRIVDELNAQTSTYLYSFVCIGLRYGRCDSQCPFSQANGNEHRTRCRRPRSRYDWDLRRVLSNDSERADWSVNIGVLLQIWMQNQSP